jgi:hypothetical protein
MKNLLFPVLCFLYSLSGAGQATGPLKKAEGSNYFIDGTGKHVYLVGSHTWSNFQDMRFEGDKKFAYDEYLQFMKDHHFNFMRFWSWEHTAWAAWTPEKLIVEPMPYVRTGTALGLDGKPKFDLIQFNQSYFDRMRARIIKARDNGIYASIMLFQAFSGVWPGGGGTVFHHDAFRGHYYNKDNNIQKFDGDKDKNKMLDIDNPEVRKYQAAYIKKVIDYVWDLDNVLYEVINEGGNLDWDRFVMNTIKEYETTKGTSHPIGLTGHGAENLESVINSPADWISPGSNDAPGMKNVINDPPLWNGKQISVLDTDHIWGHGIDYRWVWRSFLRGHNVLFMDPWDPLPGYFKPSINIPDLPEYILGRKAMKNTALFAERIDLSRMKPVSNLMQDCFCLADEGKQYLIYSEANKFDLDLSAIQGTFSVEWMHPTEGFIIKEKNIEGGKKQTLRSPLAADGVLYLKKIE